MCSRKRHSREKEGGGYMSQSGVGCSSEVLHSPFVTAILCFEKGGLQELRQC